MTKYNLFAFTTTLILLGLYIGVYYMPEYQAWALYGGGSFYLLANVLFDVSQKSFSLVRLLEYTGFVALASLALVISL